MMNLMKKIGKKDNIDGKSQENKIK